MHYHIARATGAFLASLSGLVLCSAATGQNIGDFKIPATAGLPDKAAGVTRREDPELGATVLKGSSAQAAADAAVLELVEQDEGIRLIETGSGLGIVSGASATYSTESKHPTLVLTAQRVAWVTAGISARTQLMEYFEGLSLQGKTELVSSFRAKDTDNTSEVEAKSKLEEEIRTQAQGFLRGAVTYRVHDDPDEGKVFVSVVSTPKTRDALRAESGRSISVKDYTTGMDLLKAEIKRGVLPPDGARIITVPGTGETAWVGYGAGLMVSSSKSKMVLQASYKHAKLAATRHAQQNLLRAIRGESLTAEDMIDAKFKNSIRSFDDLLGGGHEEEASVIAESASDVLKKAKLDGTLPPNCKPQAFTSADGRWVYATSIYRDTRASSRVSPKVSGLTARVKQGESAKDRIKSTPQDAATAAQNLCESRAPEGFKRVLCVGEGSSRKIALKQALLEGVERVNGLFLKGNSVVKQQYKDAVKDLNGKLDTVVSAENSSTEEISTKANGMVSTFEVIEQKKGPQGLIHLKVCVEVPVFDPKRPRPGRRPTIAVLPFRTTGGKFKVQGQPDGVDSRTVADELISDIVDGLVGKGLYTVLDRQHLAELAAEFGRLTQGLKDGSMEQGEMIKLGHKLGADYIVVGNLRHLENVVNAVNIAGNTEQQELLAIKSSCRLLSLATDAIETTDEFEGAWGSIELWKLPPSEAGMSRQTIACRRAVKSHVTKILAAMKKLKKDLYPRFMIAISPEMAVLKFGGAGYQIGDELVVRGIKRVDFEGQVEEIEIEKGRVKITRINRDKEQIYVKIIKGKGFEQGDVCRRH